MENLLYQVTIPDQRLAVGQILRNGDVTFQQGVAVKDVRSAARTLNAFLDLSSLSHKDSLKRSIDGLVASTNTAGNRLVKLSSRFEATMHNLPMHDAELVQSLTKLEQEPKPQSFFGGLKGIVSYLGSDPETTERVLEYIFKFASRPREPQSEYMEAIQKYLTAQIEALRQLMHYTIDASRPVDEIGEYLQDISDTVTKQEHQINVKERPALEALLRTVGPNHSLALQHKYDLEVLRKVDESQKEWADYCNVLLSGLQKLENDLDIIKADVNIWFSGYRSRSSIEIAMQTLKNRLLAIIAKDRRTDTLPRDNTPPYSKEAVDL
ncbi:hypothetical protein FRC17_003126 [Serendipita sp. 399]|nr:hypothetical protein FRC17_003126 [Serendipita sp. 399]